MLLEKLKKALKSRKQKKVEQPPLVVRGFTPAYSKPIIISLPKASRSVKRSPRKSVRRSPIKSIKKSPRRSSRK